MPDSSVSNGPLPPTDRLGEVLAAVGRPARVPDAQLPADRPALCAGNAGADLALDARLDLRRIDFLVAHSRLVALLEVARIYGELSLDDRLVDAMNDAAEQMRAAIAALKRLQQDLKDAAITREAAEEFRAQRDGRARRVA